MSGDSLFNYVVLGLSGDSFNDFSNYADPISNAGVSLTTQYPGVMATSLAFTDPTPSQPISVGLPTAAQIRANIDFTIETSAFIVQPTSAGGTLLSTRSYSPSVRGLYLGYTVDGTVFVRATYLGQIVIEIDAPSYLNLTYGSLHTFSIDRVNGQWTLYIDGSAISDIHHTSYYNGALDIGGNLYIGGDGYEASLVGSMSQIRWTVGAARHTAPYVPAAAPFPNYYSVDGVTPSTFGVLSSTISTSGASFTALVSITENASATVTVTNAAGFIIASGWTLVKLAGDQCILSGVAPIPLITYLVNVLVTVPSQYGGGTNTHTYKITNTAAGIMDAGQALITSIDTLALWLDANESSTLISNLSTLAVSQFVDRSSGIIFNAAPGTPPVLDTTSWPGTNSIAFSNVSSSGFTTTTPVPVTDGASNSTIYLVGKYTGQQLGQGAGNFSLAFAADTVLNDGVASWDITTTSVGMPASAVAYDGSVIENAVKTSSVISSGQKFLVVWKSSTNVLQIYINQLLVSTTAITGNTNLWSAIYSAIGFIGGGISPNGAFISIAEIIAFRSLLNEPTTISVESYLNHKWNLYTAIPFANTPDNLIGYAGAGYSAHVIVTDVNSVSVTGSDGTLWGIMPSGTGVANQYLITAVMPATVGYLTMTITGHNGSVVGSNTYVINVEDLPNTPIITQPTNAACQINSTYVGLIEVLHATTVTVVGSEGTNWTIVPIVDGVENYKITGLMPSATGTVILTVTASGSSGSATAQFNVLATATQISSYNKYQVDLTGSLSNNLISNESQTLTPQNGAAYQLIRPSLVPFYANNFTLLYYSTGQVLSVAVNGLDYYPIYELQEASRVAAYPVYGAIRVVNPAITGTVFITYQTLGGNFAANKQELSQGLVYAQVAPATAPWSRVINGPTYYPVNQHALNVQTEAVGFSGLTSAITAISASISTLNLNNDVTAMVNHMAASSNPHSLTKAQIGLGNVNNYPLATDAQAIAGVSNTLYLTPHTAYVASIALLPSATSTVLGIAMMNDGNDNTLGNNSTRYITAAGVRQLSVVQGLVATGNGSYILGNLSASQLSSNALISAIQPAMLIGQITPTPLTFPAYWQGKQYLDLNALVRDISSSVGMSTLPYSPNGMIWFPTTVTVPNLGITTTLITGSTAFNVVSTVNTPLMYSLGIKSSNVMATVAQALASY